MDKKTFLKKLRKGLSGLSKAEQEERLTFYNEMIEDRIEEGLTEEQAVAAIGDLDEIIAQIRRESCLKENRKRAPWIVLLLILGAPLWIPLVVAVLVVMVVMVAVYASMWAIFASLAACALACVIMGVVWICGGQGITGVAGIGCGCICLGLAIFLFYGNVWLGKIAGSALRSRKRRKEAVV